MAFSNQHRPLWALIAAAPLMTVLSTAHAEQTWKINLRDADLAAFINEVADITGKNFAVDPRVRGNVTVISNKPLNKDEVYDLFLGVLNVNGVVAIPAGNSVRLVPDSNVKNSGVPYDSRRSARGDQVVTRIIWLDNTNPNDLIPALRPLMPQFAQLAAVPGTNALIVSDRASNIYQLETIVRNLDGTGQNDLEAISLKSSQAQEVIGLLESMSATGSSKDFAGSRVRIVADERTNRILLKGDSGTRKRLRDLIEMLDVPSADRLGGLKVFRLKYASAKNLAEILQGLVTGKSASSSDSSSSSSNSSTNSSSSTSNTSSNNSSNTGGSSSIATPSINLSGGNANSNQNNVTSFNAGGVSIIADSTQNALVVKAEPQLMREIDAAIQQLDIRRQQVLIEAAVIEVAGDDANQLGVQWALGDLNSGVGLISFSNVGASLSSIAAGYLGSGSAGAAAAIAGGSNSGNGATFGFGSVDNSRKAYGALIQALKTNSKSNLLSTPSIVTLDNEEAYIVVGQNVPFVTGSVTTTSTGVNPYTSVERKDVGITLKVVPHIGEGGTIRLEVEQEVSAVQANRGQASDLVTSKRAIKTAVLAEHGQTIVLGGLISDDTEMSRQGLPFLSDIPYLGKLFRADSRSNKKRNLLVFIHPTIVGDQAQANGLTQQRYNQLYSLQLAMDKNGNFAKLPAAIEDVYQPALAAPAPTSVSPSVNTPTSPAPSTTAAPKSGNTQMMPQSGYQAVPSGGVQKPATSRYKGVRPVVSDVITVPKK